jgi:serine/threonine kinase 16
MWDSRTKDSCLGSTMAAQLLRAIDTLKDQAKDALWAVSSCICQQSAKVKINGRTCMSDPQCHGFFAIDQLFYSQDFEGFGRRRVFICVFGPRWDKWSELPAHPYQELLLTFHIQRQFALKKIRCPTGSDAVKEAMREVEAYRRFRWVVALLNHANMASQTTLDTQILSEY